MITTSISLPTTLSTLWRSQQHAIMRLAIRSLRIQFRELRIERGRTRKYNKHDEEFVIVTTRFTEAEYDTLHCAAHALRVSVSWLICRIIRLWIKPSRRIRENPFVTNYEMIPVYCGQNGLVFSENILIWPKPKPTRARRPLLTHYDLPI